MQVSPRNLYLPSTTHLLDRLDLGLVTDQRAGGVRVDVVHLRRSTANMCLGQPVWAWGRAQAAFALQRARLVALHASILERQLNARRNAQPLGVRVGHVVCIASDGAYKHGTT